MNNERLFDEEAEREQDKRARESLNRLDGYLSSDNGFNRDYLNDLEEDDVKIEDLRRLINQLEEMKKEYDVPQTETQSQAVGETSGKVKVKSLPGSKKMEETDNTAKEIASSFISCFILCMVTAIMGTGWFLYIINHI